MPGSLIGVTYAEFDNKVGPQLKFCYPSDVMSKELFETYSDYVIVSKQLCEKSIVVTFDEMNFLNYSVAIDNPKYDRNTLIFSFGCILVKGVDIQPYEAALRKISLTFVNLEIETEYLFQAESKLRLQDFLKKLYNDLNNCNESCIKLDNCHNYLAVKLYKQPSHRVCIQDYDVPIIVNINMDLATLPWDISFQHLIPFLDGKSHVKKISRQIDMDMDYLKRSISLLLFHQYVLLTDIFKFSSVYQITSPEYATAMLSDRSVLNEMRDFCAIDICGVVPTLPSDTQLIRFLLELQQNKTVQQVVLGLLDNSSKLSSGSSKGNSSDKLSSSLSNGSINLHSNLSNNLNSNFNNSLRSNVESDETPQSKAILLPFQNMDISRAIAFACHKNIIRRVHEYPIYTVPPAATASTAKVSMDGKAGGTGGVKTSSEKDSSCYLNTLENAKRSNSTDFNTSTAAVSSSSNSSSSMSGTRRLSFGGLEEAKESREFPVSLTGNEVLDGTKPSGGGSVGDSDHQATTNVNTESVNLNATVAAAVGASTPTSSFHKLSRSRSVVGRNYLHSSEGQGAETTGILHQSSSGKESNSLASVAAGLTGKLHLDEVCVKHDLSVSDIVQFPGISIVYR